MTEENLDGIVSFSTLQEPKGLQAGSSAYSLRITGKEQNMGRLVDLHCCSLEGFALFVGLVTLMSDLAGVYSLLQDVSGFYSGFKLVCGLYWCSVLVALLDGFEGFCPSVWFLRTCRPLGRGSHPGGHSSPSGNC